MPYHNAVALKFRVEGEFHREHGEDWQDDDAWEAFDTSDITVDGADHIKYWVPLASGEVTLYYKNKAIEATNSFFEWLFNRKLHSAMDGWSGYVATMTLECDGETEEVSEWNCP